MADDVKNLIQKAMESAMQAQQFAQDASELISKGELGYAESALGDAVQMLIKAAGEQTDAQIAYGTLKQKPSELIQMINDLNGAVNNGESFIKSTQAKLTAAQIAQVQSAGNKAIADAEAKKKKTTDGEKNSNWTPFFWSLVGGLIVLLFVIGGSAVASNLKNSESAGGGSTPKPSVTVTKTGDTNPAKVTTITVGSCVTAIPEQVAQNIGGDKNFWNLNGSIWQFRRLGQDTTLTAPDAAIGTLRDNKRNVIVSPGQQTVTDNADFICASTATVPPTGGTVPQTASHNQRLLQLDPQFRSGGVQNWLMAAGVTWNKDLAFEARQPEEETLPGGEIVVAGVQVNATNIVVRWPNIVTTDTPSRIQEQSDTVKHQPDTRTNGNKSVLYTNVIASGPVTIWVDGTNWGQFTSKLGGGTFSQNGSSQSGSSQSSIQSKPSPTVQAVTKIVQPTPSPAPKTQSNVDKRLTMSDLASWGTIILELTDEGQLAGAQIRFSKHVDAPFGWTFQKNGASVSSVEAGDVASAWSPKSIRPLAR